MQDCYLAYALTEMAGSTCMIFTRTCESTRKIALTLRNLGFGAIPIHGQMSQPKRLGALNKFKVRCLQPPWCMHILFRVMSQSSTASRICPSLLSSTKLFLDLQRSSQL